MTELNQDVPAGCVSCISRRDFVAKAAALAAVTAFLQACGDGGGISDPTGTVTIKTTDFPGLATVNELVAVGGNRAVKRTGSVSFAAYSMRCTHESFQVDITASSAGNSFVCPAHGSRFDNNGNVTLGPASRNLTVLATSYDATTDTLTIG
jgi:cytochrome b6-f complex iron-sulfur subunit